MSEKDLGQLLRLNYSPVPRFFIWFCSEFAIICADIQEIVGACIALSFMLSISKLAAVPIVVAFVMIILIMQEVG